MPANYSSQTPTLQHLANVPSFKSDLKQAPAQSRLTISSGLWRERTNEPAEAQTPIVILQLENITLNAGCTHSDHRVDPDRSEPLQGATAHHM